MIGHQHEDISDHRFEQRGLLRVEVDAHGRRVHVIVVHLGLIPGSRVRQVDRLQQFIEREVPPGSPVVVRVSDSDEPLALILDVIDRGAGIADEQLPSLFQRGSKRPGGRRQGLGLYIVHRVMELHRGSVLVERSSAGGTTMRLVVNQHAVV
mgnify:CR=1 FL=1